jgi:hypothetical protein
MQTICIFLYFGMKFYKRYRVSYAKFIGLKFNKLQILEVIRTEEVTNGGVKVKCLCDCGKETIKSLASIKAGRTQSCGCFRAANAIKQLEKANEKNPLIIKSKSNDPRILAANTVYKKTYSGNTLDNLSFDIFLELSQKNCYYCGAMPSNLCKPYAIKNSRYSKERQEKTSFLYNGLDRIDNNLGHSADNVVPCCLSCNKAKLARSKDDFLNWIEKVYNLHLKNKE